MASYTIVTIRIKSEEDANVMRTKENYYLEQLA